MEAKNTLAAKTVYCLLFRALLEIRSQDHEKGNKLVFHLSDLFHGALLEMENAAAGKCTYEDLLHLLEKRAKEKGCDKWVASNL